jgi:hypothetical protein
VPVLIIYSSKHDSTHRDRARAYSGAEIVLKNQTKIVFFADPDDFYEKSRPGDSQDGLVHEKTAAYEIICVRNDWYFEAFWSRKYR